MQLESTLSDDLKPAHIVTFKGPLDRMRESMEAVFRDVTGVRKFHSRQFVGGRRLEATGNRGVVINLHERIGAAVVVLNDDMLRKLRNDPRIANIETSRKRSIPDLHLNRGISRDAPTNVGLLSWALTRLGMKENLEWTGKGVKVAVLDTGIDKTHPDFEDRVSSGKISGVSFVPDPDIQDNHGHGTGCAGLIAGPVMTLGNCRYGVAPDVELLVGRIIGDGENWDDNILAALDWAKGEKAQVISMSFGSWREETTAFNAVYEDIAHVLRDSGIFLVAAAGNSSDRENGTLRPVWDPAAAPSIHAITSTKSNNEIANSACVSMGQWGNVALSAPGVNIYTAWKENTINPGAEKWYRNGRSGTSFATAYVAGVAALYFERCPKITIDDLESQILSDVDASLLGDPSVFGAGLVQVPS